MVENLHLLRVRLGAGALVATGCTPWPIRAAQIDGKADGYAHAEWFVNADWLRQHRDVPGLHLIAFGPADEFAAGHLPGARRVDGPALELGDTSPAAIAAWQDHTASLVAALGIEPDSTIITYDAGSLYATRPWWVLRYLGHDDVRVLDGGLAAWHAAGGTVATGMDAGLEPVSPAGATPTASTVRSDLLAPLAEVEAALGDPEVVIVDARTPEEYVAGHIPGAVNLDYPQDAAFHWLTAVRDRCGS